MSLAVSAISVTRRLISPAVSVTRRLTPLAVSVTRRLTPLAVSVTRSVIPVLFEINHAVPSPIRATGIGLARIRSRVRASDSFAFDTINMSDPF
jgi:hypothetical protein